MNKSNLRILTIAPYRFLPAINGGHKAIEQLYKNMGALTQTIVVSTKSNNERLASQFQLVKLFSDSPFHYINLFYFFKIKSLIKEYSITHVMMEHPYMGWLGFLLQRYADVSFIVRSQNIEAMRFRTFGKWWWKIMGGYEKWVHTKANMNFFITEEDKDFAIQKYKLSPHKCEVLTYGINVQTLPSLLAKQEARKQICLKHDIPATHQIILFNGDLGYEPNHLAVQAIIDKINPLLLQHSAFAYRILICGRNLPENYIYQIKTEAKNIIYTGFVNDIVSYFLAADVFINPINAGGGIKTKLVEAVGYNCNAVSTFTGAAGVHLTGVSKKLIVVEDNDWKAFTDAIVSTDLTVDTPKLFYDQFYWGDIARRAVNILEGK